jgi:D-threonate/D-erythronate kinase
VIADDLTGAADSGVQFVRAGYRTAVIFRGESVPEDVEAAVIDTDSRSLDPREARERVLGAGETLRGARIVYKKLDSTLRGPVAAELAAALEATGRARAVVAPAFPAAGRSTREGVQMVRGVPVHETEFADDPQTPVGQGHIPSLLAEAGLSRVRTLSVEDLGDGASVREVLESGRWIVADALSDAHLEALVRAVLDPSEVLWAGSAGLAAVLGAAYPGSRAAVPSGEASPVSRALAVVGSTNEVAREQLRRLVSEPGVTAVALDTRAVVAGGSYEAVEETLAAAREALVGGNSVALYSAAEGGAREQGTAGRIADALAEVVAGLSEARLFEALVMTGGDTAVRVARRLGARGILLEEELEPGVPIGTLLGPRRYRVVTKAGGFGTPDTLGDAWRVLAHGREDHP